VHNVLAILILPRHLGRVLPVLLQPELKENRMWTIDEAARRRILQDALVEHLLLAQKALPPAAPAAEAAHTVHPLAGASESTRTLAA